MNVASLFSGGKDSTFAIHLARKQGHKVTCLLSINPKSDESHLLHHPNMKWTRLQSESMGIPQIVVSSNSDKTDDELLALETLLKNAKKQFHIEGLIHGGIKSQFQKDKFEIICSKLNLVALAPLWQMSPYQYMNDLIDSHFVFIMTTVSSDGLDDSWLGKPLLKPDIDILSDLSLKFGFNLNFEGGEAETFVINCPLFATPIQINKSETNWDGYRGRFEIVDAELNYNA